MFKLLVTTVTFLYVINTSTAASVQARMRDMVLDPTGIVHIADDGVVRSYSGNGTIIDYFPLTNAELQEHILDLNRTHGQLADAPGVIAHLQELWTTTNGYDVPKNKLLNPDPENRSSSFPVIVDSENKSINTMPRGPEARHAAAAATANSQSMNVDLDEHIFERQTFSICDNTCISSAGCLFVFCGPCFHVDMSDWKICAHP